MVTENNSSLTEATAAAWDAVGQSATLDCLK